MKKNKVWGLWKNPIIFQNLSIRVLCTYRDNVQTLIRLSSAIFSWHNHPLHEVWYMYLKSGKTRRIRKLIKDNKITYYLLTYYGIASYF